MSMSWQRSLSPRRRWASYVSAQLGSRQRIDVYAYCAYTAWVSADFDPKKDAANIRKHGISLSEGDGVLSDPLALTIEDESAEGEQRFVTIGMNVFGALMVVVHTPRRDGLRIISVRKPDPRERRDYEKGV